MFHIEVSPTDSILSIISRSDMAFTHRQDSNCKTRKKHVSNKLALRHLAIAQFGRSFLNHFYLSPLSYGNWWSAVLLNWRFFDEYRHWHNFQTNEQCSIEQHSPARISRCS